MKKLIITITAALVFTFVLPVAGITAQAGDSDLKSYYEEAKVKREQREKEHMEKWLDELEKDGNLTQAAIDAAGKYGEGRVPNSTSGKKSKGSSSSGSSTGSSYSGPGKGWVYSCDELHVIGLPEGENGYTKPGWYGNID